MIDPSRKSLESILKISEVKYIVPLYQRDFDWGKNELQELIDDLKDIMSLENNELFLGNFIFKKNDGNTFEIVDGQQRLTTISIILIALREHAKKINELEFAGELQMLITKSAAWDKYQSNKVVVSPKIKDVFEYISRREWDGKFPEKINGKQVKRQVNKIKPIFQYIMKEISTYNANSLKQFTRALMKSYVVVIKVDDTDDVFSIFERTNARGLDLNIGDLLKNYIFSYGIDEFEEKWYEIIDNSENSLQRMLKYFWISRKGYVLKKELYKKLKKYGKELGIKEFVDELYVFSRYYRTVLSVDPDEVRNWLEEIELEAISKNEDYYERIARSFQALKLFRVTQAYSLIYAIFKYFKNDHNASVRVLVNVLESIEKYHFVNNVISQRIGNEVEKFYAENAKKFFHSQELFNDNMNKFLNDLRSKKAMKDEFVSKFIESVVYDQKNIALITYIFDRINNYGLKGSQRVKIYAPEKDLRKRNYNIEHILPQKMKENYSEDEKENFDKIGNLLVISRHSNSELGNKTPEEKIKIIKSDPKHYANLRYLQKFLKKYESFFSQWNFDIIDQRSRDIAEMAFEKIWAF